MPRWRLTWPIWLSGRKKKTPQPRWYAAWAAQLRETHTFTAENITGILRDEVGAVFAKVLEHAGVYKRDAAGREAFLRFVEYVNREAKV